MRITLFSIAVATAGLAATAATRLGRRDDGSDPPQSRPGKLFSTEPEAINLRSADNLRLLSEAQLRAYEEDSSELG